MEWSQPRSIERSHQILFVLHTGGADYTYMYSSQMDAGKEAHCGTRHSCQLWRSPT